MSMSLLPWIFQLIIVFNQWRSVDPFSKKDWYDVKAPSSFTHRNVGKTLVSRTQGTKVIASISSLELAKLESVDFSELI